MDRERNYVAAEEVNAADNLLKANLHSSTHTSINVPPLRKHESLQLINNINEPLSLSHKLAAKYKRRRERRLSQSRNDSTKVLDDEIRALVERLNDFGDNPNAPPNARKTVTMLHTQSEESISPLSYPTIQANANDAALKNVVEINEDLDNEMDRALRRATIDGSIPTAIVDTGASSSCVKPIEDQPTKSECGGF